MKPRKPLPKQSKRRTAEAKVYAKRKKVFLSRHSYCAGCLNPVPMESRDCHHWAGRVGKLLLEERLWLMLCDDCHQDVHDYPHAAKLRGLLAPNGCWNDYERAMKAYKESRWRLYLNALDYEEDP